MTNFTFCLQKIWIVDVNKDEISVLKNDFLTSLKIAAVLPLYKKDESSHTNNYRPGSVLGALSKMFFEFKF